MLSRYQLSSHLSKTASTYGFSVTKTSPIPSSSRSGSSFRASAAQIRSFITTTEPLLNSHRFSDPSYSKSGSLFSYEDSMDEVFGDLEGPSATRTSARHPQKFSRPPATKARQTMTERETKVLTGMLDMIFASKGSEEDQPKTLLESMTSPSEGGVGPIHVDDLFGRLRRFAARPTQKARSRAAEMLDKKKEQMSYCTDDQQLLQWASREVFDESVRYEEAAKRAIAEASNSGSTTTQAPPLQSPIYPQMIAHLMQTFRVQYHDPNLALFIFNHAQNLSIVSYVFGCSTDAYNELIETRWTAFKDLKGVLAAVNEMEVNAVPINSRTRKLVDDIRRELGQELHLGNNEDTKTLASIEETLSRMARHSKRSAKTGWDTWKKEVLDDGDDDGFDDWASVDLTKFGEPEPQAQDRFRRPGKGGQVGNKNFRNRASHKSQESYL